MSGVLYITFLCFIFVPAWCFPNIFLKIFLPIKKIFIYDKKYHSSPKTVSKCPPVCYIVLLQHVPVVNTPVRGKLQTPISECTLYNMYCTECTLYNMHCTDCTLYNMYCTECTQYNMHCTECTLYIMYCTECTLYIMYCKECTQYRRSGCYQSVGIRRGKSSDWHRISSVYNTQYTITIQSMIFLCF